MSSITDLCLSGMFFQALNTPKIVYELMTLPRPPSRLGKGTAPPHTFPPPRLRRLDLGAFDTSVVRLPNTNS